MTKGVSVRSLIVGTAIAAAIGAGAAYENLMISGSTMGFDYSMGTALFVFALFVLIVNPALYSISPLWQFSRSELATVFLLMMIACVLPTNGLVGPLIPAISGGLYYATVENGWMNSVIPVLSDWLLVSDHSSVVGFYEGLSRGEVIPWRTWVEPLLFWSAVLFGFFGTTLAITVILRQQWMENERLQYPMTQVPMAMIGAGEEGDGNVFAAIFRNRVFWLGVLVPAVMYSVKALHHYDPLFPLGLPTFVHVRFANNAVDIPFGINYAGIGFGFLVATKISFSIWVVAILTILEEVLFMRLGLASGESLIFNTSASVYPAYQGVGALLVFCSFILWSARSHIRDVFRSAMGLCRLESEREEILSYRHAVVLLIISLFVVFSWLLVAGMHLWVAVLFVILLLMMMVGVTRIVAEGGLAVSRVPLIPNDIVVAAIGGATLGGANVGVLGMTFPWAGELRTSFMSALTHGLKLVQINVLADRRRVMVGVVAALIATVTCSAAMMLYLGYTHGAVNLSAHWFFGTGSGGRVFRFISHHISQNSLTRWDSMTFVGIGGLVQILLTVAYQRLAWWPIHPLAFPIGAVWCTHQVMASMLIAWTAKTIILRNGGVPLYRKVKPFFLGMIMGQYFTGGLWIVIDAISGKHPNYLFFW